MSINNDLDPVDGSVVTNARLSSDEQGLYVDSRLIDSVTLYDANIPVEFGGFTGGVVDATTRSWQGKLPPASISAKRMPVGTRCI